MSEPAAPARKVYAVGELTRRLKLIIESEIGWVWLEGELSNVSRPASGHLYFTLKDEQAQIRGALFKGRQRGLSFVPKDGQQVRVFGQVTVYERSGQYQIIAQDMEEAGQGSLQAAFEALKKKLEAEGLFDATRKKPLPMLPQRIGLVTSPTGAAIQDMLNILSRRYPNLHLIIAPVRVQGTGAAEEIATAIDTFNKWGQVDALIVGRGGGSLEDLWAFNEEVVARAIARSQLPIISAVGHEIDFAISDFVADLRAPTPSAAAELIIRPKADFEEMLKRVEQRLAKALGVFRLELRNRFAACAKSWVFREPGNLVRRYQQELLGHRRDMANALRGSVRERQQRVDEAGLHTRHAVEVSRREARNRLAQLEGQLRLLGPQAVLARGYSITRNQRGDIVRQPKDVGKGESMVTLVNGGQIESTVQHTTTEKQA